MMFGGRCENVWEELEVWGESWLWPKYVAYMYKTLKTCSKSWNSLTNISLSKTNKQTKTNEQTKNLIAKLLSNASIVSHFLPYLFTMGMSSQEQNAGGEPELSKLRIQRLIRILTSGIQCTQPCKYSKYMVSIEICWEIILTKWKIVH